MKLIIKILIIIFLFSMLIISGCSSNKPNIRNRQFSGREEFNISEEEMQKMFEERQQTSIQSCEGKNEGDSCQIENPRGNVSGNCKIINDTLACTIERPMRQIQR